LNNIDNKAKRLQIPLTAALALPIAFNTGDLDTVDIG
tara:strand:+ start:419 stop:529 length:111 start_codon:yes stop_codon:yes gene_type:complete